MGYPNVNEKRLHDLREKHRSAVIAAVEERSKGLQAWRDSQGLASKLYNFKQDPKSLIMETNKTKTNGDLSHSESGSTNSDEVLISLTGDADTDAVPDLQEQVAYTFTLSVNTICNCLMLHFLCELMSFCSLACRQNLFYIITCMCCLPCKMEI